MLRIPVTYDLMCEVKQDMVYASSNPYHAIITRKGKKVAVVTLNPIFIEKGADLPEWEKEEVIKTVKKHVYELEEEYRRIISGW